MVLTAKTRAFTFPGMIYFVQTKCHPFKNIVLYKIIFKFLKIYYIQKHVFSAVLNSSLSVSVYFSLTNDTARVISG